MKLARKAAAAIALSVALVFSVSACGSDDDTPDWVANPQTVEEAVTLENFEALEPGMTIEDVMEIMGVAPTSDAAMDLAGNEMTTLMWVTEDGKAITVMMLGEWVAMVNQSGLN